MLGPAVGSAVGSGSSREAKQSSGLLSQFLGVCAPKSTETAGDAGVAQRERQREGVTSVPSAAPRIQAHARIEHEPPELPPHHVAECGTAERAHIRDGVRATFP